MLIADSVDFKGCCAPGIGMGGVLILSPCASSGAAAALSPAPGGRLFVWRCRLCGDPMAVFAEDGDRMWKLGTAGADSVFKGDRVVWLWEAAWPIESSIFESCELKGWDADCWKGIEDREEVKAERSRGVEESVSEAW